MTNSEEQKLFSALRGPIIYADPFGNDLMDATAAEDLKAITPVVDELIAQAEFRGRLQVLLERAAEIWERREKAA